MKWNKIIFFSKERFIKKILLNAYKRKSMLLKKKVFFNNIESQISVFWLRNNTDVINNLTNCYEIDYHMCFFINLVTQFNTFNHKIKFDIVIVNLNWNVTEIYESFPLNQRLDFVNVSHIFLFAPGTIKNFSIKLKNKVSVIGR